MIYGESAAKKRGKIVCRLGPQNSREIFFAIYFAADTRERKDRGAKSGFSHEGGGDIFRVRSSLSA